MADTLNALNSLHLAILYAIAEDVQLGHRGHRGFGWEKIRDRFKGKGLSEYLVTSSLSALESRNLVKENTATAKDVDQTYYFTEFGETFHRFITQLSANQKH